MYFFNMCLHRRYIVDRYRHSNGLKMNLFNYKFCSLFLIRVSKQLISDCDPMSINSYVMCCSVILQYS